MPTKKPRLNVTVTPEQHALLLELAELNGGSAAGYLRQMLDHSTPLLRTAVPLMRAAAQEVELSKETVQRLFDDALTALGEVATERQLDLGGQASSDTSAARSRATSASEAARAARKGA